MLHIQKAPRIGIYGSIPEDTEIFETLTTVLGYDPFKVVEVRQDIVIAPFCGRAKTFGPHFTICDIFTPTSYPVLRKRLQKILRKFAPFDFAFTSVRGYVRGDYQGKSVYSEKARTVLALDFDQKSETQFKEIHTLIIKNIQESRARIEPEFNKELFQKVPELWRLIQKYGAPYVLENYSPHLTLASGLDGTDKTCDKLVSYLQKEYGDKLLRKPIPFDAVYIFEEILGGKFDGYFKVKEKLKVGV